MQEDDSVENELKKIWTALDSLVNRFKVDDLRKMEENQKMSYQKWKEEAGRDD